MSSAADLQAALGRIDRKPYGFYKDLRGRSYSLDGFDLCIDHVQGDPFAAPSRVRVDVSPARADLPEFALENSDARRACADFLLRAFRESLRAQSVSAGSGKSGRLEISAPAQEVLERTAVCVSREGAVRVRLTAGLPASGRRILAREAQAMLVRKLPDAVAAVFEHLDDRGLRAHVEVVEDQVALRAQLAPNGLLAFVAQDSVLPRCSGADPRPLSDGLVFQVPDALARELEAPHAGRVRGLGIPRGVTLIVGGGYHGKSTLLQALALGVYDQILGDGREACVTDAAAQTIRAEDGRSTRGVDLRAFICDLPLGRRTDRFDTDDASGSTSQAAAIVEALEAGASALLIDEDTAATNFMIRDARMRALVPAAQEPITPYLDRVRQLWEERGVSSLMVVGGAGDYLDVADCVIQMDAYQPREVTSQARKVVQFLPLGDAAPRPPGPWPTASARIPDPKSFDASRGRRSERVRSVKTRAIEFGREEIDVALLYQLVDPAQARMVGDVLLALSRGLCDGKGSLAQLLDEIDRTIEYEGLEGITEQSFGDRARARRFEIASALNRLRSLQLVAAQ
ncbi:MAG: ABC-ATPase domain-containing protein [bacterium]|nr:ABC-ATPase domain-containing protein [bacterium]